MKVKNKKISLMAFLFVFLFSITSQASNLATSSNAEYEDKNKIESEDEILLIDDRVIDYKASEENDEFRAAYSIEIPKSIYMQKSSSSDIYEANYTIRISNLDTMDERSCLVIEPDTYFYLAANNKEKITVYVEQEETEFSNLFQDDLASMHMTTGYLYTEEPISSANWKGSFSFNLSMIDLGIEDEVYLEEIEEELENDLEEGELASPSNAEQEDKENEIKNEVEIEAEGNSEVEMEPSDNDINTENNNAEENADIENNDSAEESADIENSDNTEESVDTENSSNTENESEAKTDTGLSDKSNYEDSNKTEADVEITAQC